jgi:hypothetical protein
LYDDALLSKKRRLGKHLRFDAFERGRFFLGAKFSFFHEEAPHVEFVAGEKS